MICVFFVVTPKFQPKYLLKYSIFKKTFGRYLLYMYHLTQYFSLSVSNMVLGIFVTHQCLHILSHNFSSLNFPFASQFLFIFKKNSNHLLYKLLYFCFISVLYVICIFQCLNLMTICTIFQLQ